MRLKRIFKNGAIVYQKNINKDKNSITIPQEFINKWGYEYYLEMYADKIILKPIKNKENA